MALTGQVFRLPDTDLLPTDDKLRARLMIPMTSDIMNGPLLEDVILPRH